MIYKLDVAKSEINWTGFQPGNSLGGRVFFTSGTIEENDGEIIGGNLLVDMRSIEATSDKLDEANRQKLAAHLKAADFFDADIYPHTKFSISEVKELDEEEADGCRLDGLLEPTHMVTGLLEVKGVNLNVSFPARIILANNSLAAEAKARLDRTQFNMEFMLDKSFGDKKILPDFEVTARIVATAV